MCESFIVDWQEPEESKPDCALVTLHMQGRRAGLYRVKQAMRGCMLVSQGAISFPVGTRLEVEEGGGGAAHELHSARVVGNDQYGLSLAW